MKVCIARKQPFDLAGGTHTIDLEQNYDDGPAAAQCGAKLFSDKWSHFMPLLVVIQALTRGDNSNVHHNVGWQYHPLRVGGP